MVHYISYREKSQEAIPGIIPETTPSVGEKAEGLEKEKTDIACRGSDGSAAGGVLRLPRQCAHWLAMTRWLINCAFVTGGKCNAKRKT